jgi:hypothetical protein
LALFPPLDFKLVPHSEYCLACAIREKALDLKTNRLIGFGKKTVKLIGFVITVRQ